MGVRSHLKTLLSSLLSGLQLVLPLSIRLIAQEADLKELFKGSLTLGLQFGSADEGILAEGPPEKLEESKAGYLSDPLPYSLIPLQKAAAPIVWLFP